MRLKTNKTILRRLAAAALAAAMWLTPAFSAFAEGEADTIHIRDSAELARFSKNCALDTWSQGKTVVLEADIVLTDSEFEPIPTFGGIFDGQGHTISGLSVGQDLSPAGLFSVVQDGAVIKNLKVSGSVIPQGSAESVGGIAGENNGTITGCSFTGTVTVATRGIHPSNITNVRFVGDGTGIGLSASEGAFLHRCTFENWEIGAYGGLGSWVNATGCTFRGNDVGLWLDNRGDATCSGSYYGDSVYEDNGTAVRIAAMPGTETLDFNNCVFRGNGVNVENTAGYAVDLSQIVTADN